MWCGSTWEAVGTVSFLCTLCSNIVERGPFRYRSTICCHFMSHSVFSPLHSDLPHLSTRNTLVSGHTVPASHQGLSACVTYQHFTLKHVSFLRWLPPSMEKQILECYRQPSLGSQAMGHFNLSFCSCSVNSKMKICL